TLTLTFLNGPVGAFGFQFDGLEGTRHTGGIVEVFDSSNELIRTTNLVAITPGKSPYFNASGAYRYTGVPISRVVYTVADLIVFDRSPAIDNVSFESTPEPGSLVVVASALAGLVAVRRRLSRTS
ncbi:MAG: PEP-CTERM sorting domain-containing protein, partial [Bryobacteraceae bacterium]|nr:PEP-CTERM sorting domain-containing protein [Bryobacteraceae bacterium]